jgi:hypothetical protein
VHFGYNVEKFGSIRHATERNILRHRKCAMCVPGNEGKYTDTLAQYLILIVFPREEWLRERVSMLLYTTLRVLLFSVKVNLHFWIFCGS